MAQSWRHDRQVPPLDEAALERLALRYVERYATSRAKLRRYLERKLRERGWGGDAPPDLVQLADRFAELGYVDDQGFASAKAGALVRRGYGPRRVSQALRAAGISEVEAAPAESEARDGAWAAALDFARRKRLGPFAAALPDRAGRGKAIGAFLRAGHDLATARRLTDARPGEIPERDDR
ncbi:RecX family transcriptional regulator [Sphingomonas sp. ID1715]|uniref:regulatory protein RecX n=1 Tax=Sphingomonas sp. ID1715 TaxID=1656898 RepID=UPI001488419D|nr:RecX family transcriptional regulator [Sphingomonas sp. ID1715]